MISNGRRALFLTCLVLCLSAWQPVLGATLSPKGAQIVRRGSGYQVLRDEAQSYEIVAQFGRRASAQAGSRAAVRMLARLMNWYPRIKTFRLFRVRYSFADARGVEQQAYLLNVESPENNEYYLSLQVGREQPSTFLGLTRNDVQRAARQHLAVEELSQVGGIDGKHPTKVNLGEQPSLMVASRATVRTLARVVSRPIRTFCYIDWSLTTPQGKETVTVLYSPVDRDITVTSGSEAGYDTRYSSVSRRAIVAVARKGGTLQDLQRYGARKD